MSSEIENIKEDKNSKDIPKQTGQKRGIRNAYGMSKESSQTKSSKQLESNSKTLQNDNYNSLISEHYRSVPKRKNTYGHQKKRSLDNASVPPGYRLKQLNKSFNLGNPQYTANKDGVYKSPSANYSFYSKRGSIIMQIENYLAFIKKKDSTKPSQNEDEDLGRKISRLHFENRTMIKEFRRINTMINALLQNTNLNFQSINAPKMPSPRSTSAVKLRVWEKEAENYDKITMNLEHEYFRLEKRLNSLADPSSRLLLEDKIATLDHKIEKHKQMRKSLLLKHMKKGKILQISLKSYETGKDQRNFHKSEDDLVLLREKLTKTREELDKNEIAQDEKSKEVEQLEEKYEKLIIIGKKYGLDIDVILGLRVKRKLSMVGLEMDYKTLKLRQDRLRSYNRSQRGKIELVNKDFEYKYKELMGHVQVLSAQLNKKDIEVEDRRNELADMIQQSKYMDNSSIINILHKWENDDPKGHEFNMHHRSTGSETNTQYNKLLEDGKYTEERTVLFIQSWFRMWRYKQNKKNSKSKSTKKYTNEQHKRKFSPPKYPKSGNYGEEEQPTNAPNRNLAKGKEKLTKEEEDILAKYKQGQNRFIMDNEEHHVSNVKEEVEKGFSPPQKGKKKPKRKGNQSGNLDNIEVLDPQS